MKIIFNKLIDCKVKKIKTQNSQPRLNKTVAPERKPEKNEKTKKKKKNSYFKEDVERNESSTPKWGAAKILLCNEIKTPLSTEGSTVEQTS